MASSKLKENLKDVEFGFKTVMKISWRFFIALLSAIFQIIWLLGSIAAFILLAQLYPEIYTKIILLIIPGVLILIKVFHLLTSILVFSAVFYLATKIFNMVLKTPKDKQKRRVNK